MKKNNLINFVVVVLVLILAAIILINPFEESPTTTKEIAQCIGERAILYVQLGCHYCEEQLDLFGEYKEDLAVVDCFYEKEQCVDVAGTPSWRINDEIYRGVQSIDFLKNETGCY